MITSLKNTLCLILTGLTLFAPAYTNASAVKDQSQFTTNYSKIEQAQLKTLRPVPNPITVQKIIDGVSFLGSDNQIYRLSGIDIPDFNEAGDRAAQQALQGLIEGKQIRGYMTKQNNKGRTNRMGHILIHAVTKDNVWVQGFLLSNGLPRVMTTPSNPELARPMLNLENFARQTKKQLWANDNNKIITSDEAIRHVNSFQIIEGVVNSTATVKNQLYLNFGIKGQNDWRKDFTIGISPALRKSLTRQNINLMNMQGAQVRVRGWLENYNGAYINLTHPEQFEVLKTGRPMTGGEIQKPKIEQPKMNTPQMPKIPMPTITREELPTNE